MGINDLSKAAADGELWQILPNSQDGDENSLDDHVTQVFAGEETSEDGIPQIIYVSYQDPDDPNQNRTLHFGKKKCDVKQLKTIKTSYSLKEKLHQKRNISMIERPNDRNKF